MNDDVVANGTMLVVFLSSSYSSLLWFGSLVDFVSGYLRVFVARW